MDEQTRIARAMLGALIAILDTLIFSDLSTERLANMLQCAIEAGEDALGTNKSATQDARLKEEFVALLQAYSDTRAE